MPRKNFELILLLFDVRQQLLLKQNIQIFYI